MVIWFQPSSIVMGIATMFGMILLVLPGIYFMIAAGWTFYLIIDRDEPWMDAIKASMTITNRMFLDLLGFMYVQQFVVMVGYLACGLGIFVSAPVAMVMKAVLFKKTFGIQGGANALD